MELGPIPTLQPRLKVLNRRQALAIHTAALEILEKIGIKMEHAECLDMLAGAGGRVFDKDWIRLPAYLAEEALRSAPRQIALYDQHGNKTAANLYLFDYIDAGRLGHCITGFDITDKAFCFYHSE